MNMADTTAPAYQYTPLQHPESIRTLVLHPAEDRNAPIVCSFLDENPIVPKIEEWECRAADPRGCTGNCFYGHIDEESHHGPDGKSPCDSAEGSEDEHADERQELAIENMDHADDNHDDKPENEGDDGISTDDNDVNFNEESNESNDEVLCCECGYDKYEKEHWDEENDDDCPCDCHNDEPVSVNGAESVVNLLPTREWHEKVFRPPGFPKYEALSYTWGDTSDSLPAMLGPDGAQIMVTPNCFGALQDLRLQTSDRLLWIDAICINQKDDLEKTGQVRMMGRVYAASYQVVIHLGDETPSSRILFEELALAAKAPKVFKDSGYGGREELDRPFPRPELIEAVEQLLQRPWFSRVWVLQEANNSKLATVSNAAIICGSFSSQSDWLLNLIFGYSHYRVTRNAIPFCLRCITESFKGKKLWSVIISSLGCAATDSRDRVFALPGLMTGDNAELDNLINYTDGLEVAFFKIAEYLLKSESNLSLLSLVRHPHQMAMPSWIPSWTNISESRNAHLEVRPERPGPESFASARDTTEVRFETCSCRRCTGKHAILRVRGFEVSVVEHTGTPFMASDPLLLEEQAKSFLFQIDHTDPWGYKAAHQSPNQTILQELRVREYDSLKMAHILLRGSYGPNTYERWLSGKWLSEKPNSEISEHIPMALQGYSLYIDSTGEVGLVPKEARPGDAICYIKQASFAVLRPRNAGGWELISGFCSRGTVEVWETEVDDIVSAGYEEVDFEIW